MKLHFPHSVRPDVVTGLALFLTVAGGLTWSSWSLSQLSFVLQPVPQSPIEQPAEKLAKVSPTVMIPQAAPSPVATQKPDSALPLPSLPTQSLPLESALPQPVLQPSAQVYWLQATDNQIAMMPIEIAGTPEDSEAAVLTKALNYLLARPQTDKLNSTIPAGTRLLSLQIQPTGIDVNLSKEFTEGGGTDSMTYRVAQVLYTVTSLDPQAKVYLSVEGQLLDEDNPLGGEGLMLQQPLTRQQFVKDFLSQE
jgi:spore germination protein GerM